MGKVKDFFINCLLKTFVVVIYIVSHLYDYLSYPVYFVYSHPWLVRRYKREAHARKEVRQDCVIYHSIQKPGPLNVDIERNNLRTMNEVFDYLCSVHNSKDCLGTREFIAEEDEVQPNGKVFKKLVLGKYKWRSFSDFTSEATRVSVGFAKLGIKSKSKVAFFAETRAEWIIAAYAAFKNNVTIVTIYTTLGTDGIAHAIKETKVSAVLCSHETWPKLKSVISDCPSVQKVIVMENQLTGNTDVKTDSLAGKEVLGYKDLAQTEIDEDEGITLTGPQANDIAIIMYTSGSTGTPKGVMITHENMITAMSGLVNIAKFKSRDRYIGYLPLAHVLELLAETSCLMYGIKIGYSSPNTLTNKSTMIKAGTKGDANILKPTLICAVPLVLERIYKSILDTMHRKGWAAEELFDYFMKYKMKWQDRGFDTPILNKTVFRVIRYFLGGRVKLMLSGGAPLSPDTHSLTRTCLCVPLMQGYGLTETSSSATVTSPHDRTTGRAGSPLMNVRIKLVNWEEGGYLISDKPYPRGEIHVGGKNVALGYYNDEAKTAEDFYEEDDVRWFRTGDIGEFHHDGVLKIIDRKKDLVKLQHGEYISYGKVEAVLKTCPIVENICLYADSSKEFVVAIVVPSHQELAQLSKKPIAEAIQDPKIRKEVVSLLQNYGINQNLQKVELPHKVSLTLDEWTPDSGMVTAAFKLRRREVVERYRKEIDEMYQS